MCHVHYSLSIYLKKKERKYSEQLYVKKATFSTQDTTTNKTIIYEKKASWFSYVAYIQESPETVNPSVSSLPVLTFLLCFFLELIKCKSIKIYLHLNNQSTSIPVSTGRWKAETGGRCALTTTTNPRCKSRSAHSLRTHSPSSSFLRASGVSGLVSAELEQQRARTDTS